MADGRKLVLDLAALDGAVLREPRQRRTLAGAGIRRPEIIPMTALFFPVAWYYLRLAISMTAICRDILS